MNNTLLVNISLLPTAKNIFLRVVMLPLTDSTGVKPIVNQAQLAT
jgi:hypothetical protein